MKVIVDGQDQATSFQPVTYIVIDKKWQQGDKIEIDMPMEFHVEELKQHPEYISLFRGPSWMGSKVGGGDVSGLVADADGWGCIVHGSLVSLVVTPALVAER